MAFRWVGGSRRGRFGAPPYTRRVTVRWIIGGLLFAAVLAAAAGFPSLPTALPLLGGIWLILDLCLEQRRRRQDVVTRRSIAAEVARQLRAQR